MKEIKAIIQPFMLEKVTAALHAMNALRSAAVIGAAIIGVKRSAKGQSKRFKVENEVWKMKLTGCCGIYSIDY